MDGQSVGDRDNWRGTPSVCWRGPVSRDVGGMDRPSPLPWWNLSGDDPGLVERGTWRRHHGREPSGVLRTSHRNGRTTTQGLGVAGAGGSRVPVPVVLEAVAKPDRDSGVTRRASRGGGATERPNKELKLTKHGQLRSFAACAYPVCSTWPNTLWWSMPRRLRLARRRDGQAGRRRLLMPLAGLARVQAYSAARLRESDHVSWARRQGPAAGRCGGPCDPQPAGVCGGSRISRSVGRPANARARSVAFVMDTVVFSLEDGRSVSAPVEWFPRLRDA